MVPITLNTDSTKNGYIKIYEYLGWASFCFCLTRTKICRGEFLFSRTEFFLSQRHFFYHSMQESVNPDFSQKIPISLPQSEVNAILTVLVEISRFICLPLNKYGKNKIMTTPHTNRITLDCLYLLNNWDSTSNRHFWRGNRA